ncbi:hypothetical protein [Cytobacillus massiliigabonensis]|nr:hypothetical protein [Cytobacillus massiliigabonensis]
MKPKVNSHEMAKVMQSVLNKGQNENRMTVKELLNDIRKQLEPHYKK